MLDEARPVYTIGTAAEILGVHPRTLRLYEDGGLIRPARKNNRRFYSAHDLEWISCVRYLLHQRGLNQEGLRRLLALVPCWDVRGCSAQAKEHCVAWKERSLPCWDLARRGAVKTNGCYKCDVYMSAMEYVLDEEELEEARSYILSD